MKLHLFITGTLLLSLLGCQPEAAAKAPDDQKDIFLKYTALVKSAQVIVLLPKGDPLEEALSDWGGFPSNANVSRACRPVLHSFAVGYDAKGNATEAVFLNDQNQVQVSTDPDIVGVYAAKAHTLVSTAPAIASSKPSDSSSPDSSTPSGPFNSGGGSSGGSSSGHHSSARVHGKDIEVGMTKSEVRHKLGPPDAVFNQGTGHETWLIKPLDPVHDIAASAITTIASGFGMFGTPAVIAGDKLNKKQKSYSIRFDGDTVSSVEVDAD